MTEPTIIKTINKVGRWYSLQVQLFDDKTYSMELQYGKNYTTRMKGKGWDDCMLKDDYEIVNEIEIGIVTIENGSRHIAMNINGIPRQFNI